MPSYSDGTLIPTNLPTHYKPANTEGLPADQKCSNCHQYINEYCQYWKATVRPDYWCYSWSRA